MNEVKLTKVRFEVKGLWIKESACAGSSGFKAVAWSLVRGVTLEPD